MKLTELECQEIAAKIDSEGFDYYFVDYGPDKKLVDIRGSHDPRPHREDRGEFEMTKGEIEALTSGAALGFLLSLALMSSWVVWFLSSFPVTFKSYQDAKGQRLAIKDSNGPIR